MKKIKLILFIFLFIFIFSLLKSPIHASAMYFLKYTSGKASVIPNSQLSGVKITILYSNGTSTTYSQLSSTSAGEIPFIWNQNSTIIKTEVSIPKSDVTAIAGSSGSLSLAPLYNDSTHGTDVYKYGIPVNPQTAISPNYPGQYYLPLGVYDGSLDPFYSSGYTPPLCGPGVRFDSAVSYLAAKSSLKCSYQDYPNEVQEKSTSSFRYDFINIPIFYIPNPNSSYLTFVSYQNMTNLLNSSTFSNLSFGLFYSTSPATCNIYFQNTNVTTPNTIYGYLDVSDGNNIGQKISITGKGVPSSVTTTSPFDNSNFLANFSLSTQNITSSEKLIFDYGSSNCEGYVQVNVPPVLCNTSTCPPPSCVQQSVPSNQLGINGGLVGYNGVYIFRDLGNCQDVYYPSVKIKYNPAFLDIRNSLYNRNLGYYIQYWLEPGI